MSKTTRARYTLEFELEAVRLVKAGQSVAAVAATLDVPAQSISNWVKAAQESRNAKTCGCSVRYLIVGRRPRRPSRPVTLIPSFCWQACGQLACTSNKCLTKNDYSNSCGMRAPVRHAVPHRDTSDHDTQFQKRKRPQLWRLQANRGRLKRGCKNIAMSVSSRWREQYLSAGGRHRFLARPWHTRDRRILPKVFAMSRRLNPEVNLDNIASTRPVALLQRG